MTVPTAPPHPGGKALRAGAVLLSFAALVAAVRAARRRRQAWVAAGRYTERVLTETLTLPRHRQHLYWMLREAHRTAPLVDPAAQVEQVDESLSRWTLAGPDGAPVSCTVEITGDVPEMMIAWSVPNGPLPHQGRVEFRPVADGTRLRVQVRYAWSRERFRDAGITEDAPARLLRRALNELRTQARPAQPQPH